jgi:hypothetical protein
MRVSRENLYEEVWAKPMTEVARRYGTFSTLLARICTRLNVPRPPRGYWAKLKVGRAPRKPPLPEARPGDELEWIRGSERRRYAVPLPPATLPATPRRIRASAVRATQHPLLAGAQQCFEQARVMEDGYLRPGQKAMVDIFVSRDVLPRALEVANELFLLLERRGHRVVSAPRDVLYFRKGLDHREKGVAGLSRSEDWGHGRPTLAFMGGVAFGLTLFEQSEQCEMRYVDGKYVPAAGLPVPKRSRLTPSYDWTTTRQRPSGRLCVQAYSPYAQAQWSQRWCERTSGELSTQFSALVRRLEQEAPTLAGFVADGERKAEEERRRWEEERRKNEREAAERRRLEELRRSREELVAIINDWDQARSVETFFEETEGKVAELNADERIAVLERLDRARKLLGGTDALERFRQWRPPQENE